MAELNHYNCIYRIVFPNGKCYVGQALDFEKRKFDRIHFYKSWIRHLEGNVNAKPCDTPKLFRAIKSHDWDVRCLNYEIIEENIFDIEKLNEKEIFYIKYFDCIKNGYNIVEGGNKLINPETGKHVSYNPDIPSRYDNPSLYNKYRDSQPKRKSWKKEYHSRWQKEKASHVREYKKQYFKTHPESVEKRKEYSIKYYKSGGKERDSLNKKYLRECYKIMFNQSSNSLGTGRWYKYMFGGGRTRSFKFVPCRNKLGYLNEQECWLFDLENSK